MGHVLFHVTIFVFFELEENLNNLEMLEPNGHSSSLVIWSEKLGEVVPIWGYDRKWPMFWSKRPDWASRCNTEFKYLQFILGLDHVVQIDYWNRLYLDWILSSSDFQVLLELHAERSV